MPKVQPTRKRQRTMYMPYDKTKKPGFFLTKQPKNSLFKGAMTSTSIETKFHDVTSTVACNTSGPSSIGLNTVPQGDDSVNRDGRKIVMKSILLRLSNYSTVTTGLPQTHRILVVYDKLGNGSTTLATYDDVLENTTPYYIAPINKINTKRFVVLFDQYVDLGGTTSAGYGNNTIQTYKLYKKLPLLQPGHG